MASKVKAGTENLRPSSEHVDTFPEQFSKSQLKKKEILFFGAAMII
jgi:hypothetical protein